LALDLEDSARMAELKRFCEEFVPGPEVPIERDRVYTCGAGQTSFTVDPYGRLQMCQLSRKSYFDLKQGSFAEGWNDFFPMLRARTWQTASACRTCSLAALCGSCPGAAEMEHGDIEAMVVGFCEIAHLRADAVLGGSSGHRRDGTCCLGQGKLVSQPAAVQARATQSGCGGSCSEDHGAAAPALIQIQRSR
jgi:radical SAM protein with 4Fe4S-binding SPASM domain